MKTILLIAYTAAALAAGDDETARKLPPVLRPLEPADSNLVQLPRPARAAQPAVPRFRTVYVAAPVPAPSPLPSKLVLAPLPPLPAIPKPAPATVAHTASVEPLPVEAQKEVAFYCQKQIGVWTEADARRRLGEPVRSRAAFDELHRANGRIYAFHDPTSSYREVELDFDSRSGTLRSVFVYPKGMTWGDVRRRWDGEVSASNAPQGRKFYSFNNRRLDVLVDAQGKVISFGLY